MSAPRFTPAAIRTALALGAVYLFWGSTAPAMKVAIETLPPFAMVTVRFFCGGAILWTIARATGVPMPQRAEWGTAFVTGAILLVGSNALFCWTLLAMPSGLGSLFFALSPLWMAIFAASFFGERMLPVAVGGLALGLTGMLAIFVPSAGRSLPVSGILVSLLCSVLWAFGSIVQRRFPSTDLVQTSAMQMLCAAPVTAIVSLATREHPHAGSPSASSLWALAYLVVFGSVVGFSSFLWLMRNVPTALASTYAYVNPVVSIAIGTLFLRETLSWPAAFGAAITVAGVALVMLAPRLARGSERRAAET